MCTYAKNRGPSSLACVIQAVRDQPGITRSQIVRVCSLSKPTVSEILKTLIRRGLVKENGVIKDSGVGRDPISLTFNYAAFQVLAIDVGGTNLRSAVLDLNGNILWRYSEKADPKILFEQIRSLANMSIHNAEEDHVFGISLGVAGTVDPKSGTVLSAPAFGKQKFKLRELLKETNLPILVENDVNLAALGEHWRGASRGSKNSVCISIGTGIGAGLILNGRLYRGSHNLAGEIGYFSHGADLPDQPIIGFGELELRAGGYGIRKQALMRLKHGATSILPSLVDGDLKLLDARTVLWAAAKGDPVSLEIVQSAGLELGRAIANVISLLDLDVVVLTGGVLRTGAPLIPSVKHVVEQVALPDARGSVKIRIGQLEDAAVLIGGAFQVQEDILPLLVKGKQ